MSTTVKTDIAQQEDRTIRGSDIPIGTYFTAKPNYHDHSLFLRAYDRIVDLKSPNKTWDVLVNDREKGPEFTKYVPLSSVHITGNP